VVTDETPTVGVRMASGGAGTGARKTDCSTGWCSRSVGAGLAGVHRGW